MFAPRPKRRFTIGAEPLYLTNEEQSGNVGPPTQDHKTGLRVDSLPGYLNPAGLILLVEPQVLRGLKIGPHGWRTMSDSSPPGRSPAALRL
jgi:hypothetical protein